MGRKISDGRSIKVTVPQNTTVDAGKFYLLDGFFGMAVQSVVTGAGQTAEITLNIEEAEYETSQITVADAFNKGDKVYWNAGTSLLTTQPNNDASGNPQAAGGGEGAAAEANLRERLKRHLGVVARTQLLRRSRGKSP